MRFRAVVALVIVVLAVGGPATATTTLDGSVGSASAVGVADTNAIADRGVADDAQRVGKYTDSNQTATTGYSQVSSVDDQHVTIRISLQENGDARWTVTITQQLDDENETAAFRTFARRWVNRTANVEFSAALFRQFATLATNATGRSMRVPPESVTREFAVGSETGELELSFRWTNFAKREGGQLVVDDVFETPTGTWLPRIEANQKLVIEPPAGFSPDNSPPGPRLEDGTLIWEGPRTFGEDYFRIIYTADNTPTSTRSATTTVTSTSSSTGPGTTGSSSPTGPPDGMFSQGLMFGIVAAVLLGGGMALYRARGDTSQPVPGGDGGSDTGAGPATAAAADADSEPTGDEAHGEGTEITEPADDTDAASEPEPTPEDPFAGVDVDLLSDEERVIRLLEANGGRMKQGSIVKETGWSNAKVSQLLSGMDDDDEIDKLRIGRENLISLPDVDVQDFD